MKERNPDIHYIALIFALVTGCICLYFIRAYHDLHFQAVTRIARARSGDMLRSEVRAREMDEAAESWKEVSQLVQRGKALREHDLRAEFEAREREMREEFKRDKENMMREARAKEAALSKKAEQLSRAMQTKERIIADKSDELARLAKRG